nr:receptor-like serine/threonine-protein kinase ALE2 [Ipomoea batatas]
MSSLLFLCLLPLLTLLPTSLGILTERIGVSPSLLPSQSYITRRFSLEDVRLDSTSAPLAPLSTPHRHHSKPSFNPTAVPAPSPGPQGPLASPNTWQRRHHRRHHRGRTPAAVSPSPATGSGTASKFSSKGSLHIKSSFSFC